MISPTLMKGVLRLQDTYAEKADLAYIFPSDSPAYTWTIGWSLKGVCFSVIFSTLCLATLRKFNLIKVYSEIKEEVLWPKFYDGISSYSVVWLSAVGCINIPQNVYAVITQQDRMSTLRLTLSPIGTRLKINNFLMSDYCFVILCGTVVPKIS